MAIKEPTIKDFGKIDPDDLKTYKDAFLNLLGQKHGVQKEPFHYVVCPDEAPSEFMTVQEERMFQLPHTGAAFELNNHQVYQELKTFLINSPGWTWIELHDSAEDGCAAFKAWVGHYNSEGNSANAPLLPRHTWLRSITRMSIV